MIFKTFPIQLLLIPLTGLFSLVAVNTAFRRLHRKDSKKQLDLAGKRFFYRYLASFFFPKHEYEDLYFASLFAQNVLRFCYAILAFLIVLPLTFKSDAGGEILLNGPLALFYLFLFFCLLFFFGDCLPRVLGNRYPEKSISLYGPIVSTFMLLLFPFIFLFLKLFHRYPTVYVDPSHAPLDDAKQELMEMIEEYTTDTKLEPHDKKLIESVMDFKNRIAREIMVPRVAVFSLSAETTIRNAAKLLAEEGYSRTPVYENSLDEIVGVLMYKDLLAKYMECAQKGDLTILDQPILGLVKNVLYTPETKKIAQLLQEFRKKQVHLAIIVDEYGGTEGIVTIEDILEEIVGEIADEYDEDEALILPLPEGGWLIDARLGILDLEEQLGIELEQEGDYDTLGGYIFHQTGMIPPKGFVLKKENFEIEVLRSNDRRVEKLKIQFYPTEEEEEGSPS